MFDMLGLDHLSAACADAELGTEASGHSSDSDDGDDQGEDARFERALRRTRIFHDKLRNHHVAKGRCKGWLHSGTEVICNPCGFDHPAPVIRYRGDKRTHAPIV